MSFPPDWTGINSDGFVGAQFPNEETFVMLALVSKGADPISGANVASKKLKIDLVKEAQLGTINGLPAAKNRTQFTGENGELQKLELTWIAYGGLIYQIMGAAAPERFDALEEIMRKSANSFRALSADEISQIQVIKLQIVAARQGESIAELAERVKTPWSAEAISVVNHKSATAPLEVGELLKVGIHKIYVGRPRPDSKSPAD
ncbi:MAG: hypothetical protein E4H01_02385 [Lysobacterales bacterium]|nr:MAG: hypothetical protein E4H01_02385 [Xanthomonadales bacterium]